jgi:hypothetical protein
MTGTRTSISSICRALVALGMLALPLATPVRAETKFRPVPVQFIAALGEPTAKSGTGADTWGLWPIDPGPRGVRLSSYDTLKEAGGITPTGWTFNGADWWLEEHGLIMENPPAPLAAGKYLVTGDRRVMTTLTIHPADKDGTHRWELADDATLYDVTHLRCRSARYKPATSQSTCTPATVQQSLFPVAPGGVMPAVAGCVKQDYAVLFIVGVADAQ